MNTIPKTPAQARRAGRESAKLRLEGKAHPDDLAQGVLNIVNALATPHGDGYLWTERGEDVLIAYVDGALEAAAEILDQASKPVKLRAVK